jgi:hypothetical protein
MVVRFSALRAGRLLHPGRFLVLTSVRGWVHPRTIVRLEGLGQLKNPVTSSGNEPATFRLVTYCPNQLRYRVPPFISLRHILILWRVHCSVTNNNRLWIGLLDLTTASFTITRNHNQLQELRINLQPNFSSLSTGYSPPSRSRSMTDLIQYHLYNREAGSEKTHPLSSNGYMRIT